MDTSPKNNLSQPQASDSGVPDERLQHELNLLRIEGRYFCFDKQQAVRQTEEIKITEEIKTFEQVVERPLRIKPDPDYGRPGVLAYKVMHALLKKLTDRGYPFPQSVTVSNKEIAQMIGRKSYDGKAAAEFFNAIMQLRRTYVVCSFFDKQQKTWRMLDFNLIHSTRADLEETKTGKRLRNATFQFPRPIVDSLNSRYLFTLNYAHLNELAVVGMALYKHLFFHFSHLLSFQESTDFTFRKDYEAICNEWLGGLKKRQYKSHIKQQLGRHLDDLKTLGLIRAYEVEKNSDETGFNITFYPGRSFFENHARFYGGGLQLDLSFEDEDEQAPEAANVVAYFHRTRLGVDALESRTFSDKELVFAKELLDSFSTQTVQQFVDYAIAEAKKTGFQMQTFGGTRQYLDGFKLAQKKREKKQKQAQKERTAKRARRAEAELKDKYYELREKRIRALKTTLDDKHLDEITNECRARIAEEHGRSIPGFDLFVQQEVDSEIARRADVPSLKAWKREQRE